MPLLHNAKKALRVAKRKTGVNNRVRSRVKTSLDLVKKSPTGELLSAAFSSLDKAVKGKVMHKNKAARLKHQLSKLGATGTAKKTVAKAPAKPKAPANAKAVKSAPKAVAKKAPAKKTATKKSA